MAIKLFARKRPILPIPMDDAPVTKVARGIVDFDAAPKLEPHPDPLELLLRQRRFIPLLCEETALATHLEGTRLLTDAVRALESEMALVPAGWVTIPMTIGGSLEGEESEIDIEPYYLAVDPVTNEQFQHFVDAGSYDMLELWPEDIWPHLIEFQDQTGAPGPRYWRDGRHDRRKADHPVVGVSWYEARAYARWVKMRLPTEAEWQMVASWRIKSSAGVLRRFPWGDAMDCTRCNLWGSGIGTTVSVKAYERGAAPNGVRQLVGNVWEWMGEEFIIKDAEGRTVIAEMPMKGVRGAAFDTYFETQAAAEFRSGLIALSRNRNTGFRCALSVRDAIWLED